MSNIIPIQITLQAASAADARQLVQDLAGTMAANPTLQVPVQTVATPEPAPVQPYAAPQPVQYAAPPQPVYPAAVPVAAPAQPMPAQQPPAAVPTSAPAYDMNQLAVAATALMEAGTDITALLAQFGVQALTQLPKERYGEFATVLRNMGARI